MNDRTTGTLLMIGAIGILALYSYGLYQFTILVLAITAFIAVALVLGLVGWIGYSIATTSPPPSPEPEPSTGQNEDKKTEAASSTEPAK